VVVAWRLSCMAQASYWCCNGGPRHALGVGLGSGGLSGESPTRLHAEANNGDAFGALLLVRGIIYSEVSFLLGLVEKSWFLLSGDSIPSWRHRRRDRPNPQIKLLVYFGGFARAPVSQSFGGLQAVFCRGGSLIVASVVRVIIFVCGVVSCFFSCMWLFEKNIGLL